MPSTQAFLQFDHVRNDVVVLRSGDLRAVLAVLPINFGLKSQDEQEAITFAFQNFLNSLDFDLQILVHSRKVNIDPYLKDLEGRAAQQDNELLRMQTEEYIEYIRSFISETNVMKKEFYLVVPFATAHAKKRGLLPDLSALLPKVTSVNLTPAQFAGAHAQILQRVAFLQGNLQQMGLESTMIKTKELIELLWRLNNRDQEEAGGVPEVAVETASTSA